MAARKKNQDEKNLKLLRELANLPYNKQCFDCRQKGPTYVNMTIGSFVCTTCSGILRGLNPPHRVKSISMTSFTLDDIEFIKSKGNEFCRLVWFGLSDQKTAVGPESKDEHKIKDYMMQVYEKKKWWVDPSTVRLPPPQSRNSSVTSPPEKIPLSKLLGRTVAPLCVPTASQSGAAIPAVTRNETVSSSTNKKLDLFAQLGGDPFSSNTSSQDAGININFANFDDNPAFSNVVGSNATSPPQAPPPSELFPASSSSNDGFPTDVHNSLLNRGASSGDVAVAAQRKQSTNEFMSAGDKYAALADLDSLFSSTTVTTTTTQSSEWDNGPPSANGPAPIPSGFGGPPSANGPAPVPSAFGGDVSGPSNPFGVNTPAQWNTATQPPNNLSWMSNQQGITSGQTPSSWNQQMASSPWQQQQGSMQPVAPAWNANVSGPAPAQNSMPSWNQQSGMPAQSAFSTGNPFQMNSQAPGGNAFPVCQNQPTGIFSSSQSAGGGFGQMSSSQTSTVPSDATFGNFNNAPGFAPFSQNVTSPPNGQPAAQVPVQNGGFSTSAVNSWGSTSSTSASWGQQAPTAKMTGGPAGMAVAGQFANWQQTNPFMAGNANSSAVQQRAHPSNPFL